MMKKVSRNFLPRSFCERSRYHGFCMVFSLFMTIKTCRNNIFNMLAYSRGRHTDSHALSRHRRIPCWTKWSLPRISNQSRDWSKYFFGLWCWRIQLRYFWPSFNTEFLSFLHTSSSCWWSRNSSNFRSLAGKLSRMLGTDRFRSSVRRISSLVGGLHNNALERVSAMTNSFPGIWRTLNEYFISLILNRWIPGGSSSRFFEPNNGTSLLCSVPIRMYFPKM